MQFGTCRRPDRFYGPAASGSQFLEQRARAVFAVAVFAQVHLHDGQAHIQADHVGQCQGANRLVAAEFHAASMSSAIASPSDRTNKASLIIGADAVDDEAGRVFDGDGVTA